jgi:transposase
MHAIGIDMSKASFHAALDDRVVKKFINTEEGIATFLKCVRASKLAAADILIGIESTGVYHLLFCTRVTAAGYIVMIINPLESHRFMAARTLRNRKTDSIDALNLRALVAAGIGRRFIETEDMLALKALVTEREGLVGIRASMKNRREARQTRMQVISNPLYDSSRTVVRALDLEVRALEKQLLAYAPQTQELLQSIPGVGAIAAASLVAYIADIKRFPTPEKLVAYIGLDCRVHESGTSIKGRSFISKRGSRQPRTVLFNAAFIAQRRNPELSVFFKKKIGEGKAYRSALTAVERKLVHIIWAVWTRGTPFVART